MKYKFEIAALALCLFSSCGGDSNSPQSPQQEAGANPGNQSCQLVGSGSGPTGTTAIHTQAIVTGLNTPWDIAFLPGGTDWLVSERSGRLRLVRNGTLVPAPVMTVDTVQSGEGGLLGIALDPGFSQNSSFYVFLTAVSGASYVNRVQRYQLSADHTTATAGAVIIDNITWNSVHNGGRIKFGTDGDLYISTGEGSDATLPENGASPNGKILRITSSGAIPGDNPDPTQPWYIKGLRNPQGFDWLDSNTLIVTDNGPTGEYEGRTGGDKVLVAQKGEDMGWPTIWHCETAPGLVSPILTWTDAVPPGGALFYTGGDIPQWSGNVLFGSTGAEDLQRLVLNSSYSLASEEVYLADAASTLGRLRSTLQGPNGELYITTSNCDSRGSCPAQQDGIYRILAGN
jgi:glucose/arabinose dehydrogenase